MKSIAVIGSINMDVVISSDRFPKKGETIIGRNFFTSPGGKGANQAIAAARCGANISFYGCVGNDEHGMRIVEHFKRNNIESKSIEVIETLNTGVAFITVSENDNHIIIDLGANAHTDVEYVERHKTRILSHDIYLLQLEVPLNTVQGLIDILHEHGKIVVLDPAPAVPLTHEILTKVDYLIPNEHEYQIIFNTEERIEKLLLKYPNKLIVTEGKKGIIYHNGEEMVRVKGIEVNAVDTTGAGDTFAGVLTAFLANGKGLKDAINFANHAAALSTTKVGAQIGMPTLAELNSFMKKD